MRGAVWLFNSSNTVPRFTIVSSKAVYAEKRQFWPTGFGIEQHLAIERGQNSLRQDTHRHAERGTWFVTAVRGVAPPAVDTRGYQCGDHHYSADGQGHNDPLGWRRNAIFRGGRRLGDLVAARQIVLGKQMLFIEAEVAGNGAHEAAIEDAAGELVPIFVFERFQKAQADARGHNDFVGRNLAQFALAL